jgi:predicted nucleotidyltransferase
MVTITFNNPIASALFSKNRRAILALLFGYPDQAFYLRKIARTCGSGIGAIQRELKQLTEAGIIQRMVRDKQVYFQANEDCPIFEELKSLVVKTASVADVLRFNLETLRDRITTAFIHGSVARASQKRGSDVDLVIVGQVAFTEIVKALAGAQEILGREVSPIVYTAKEFQAKISAGHHFLNSVMKKEKIFLIGDESDLARLAKKRLAHRP